jgi:hypothetical protein
VVGDGGPAHQSLAETAEYHVRRGDIQTPVNPKYKSGVLPLHKRTRNLYA